MNRRYPVNTKLTCPQIRSLTLSRCNSCLLYYFHIFNLLHRVNLYKWPTWCTIRFFLYLFIPILYVFRATKCSSSRESIVSIRPLVYVTLCRWPCGVQVWMEHQDSQLYQYDRWYMSLYVGDRVMCRFGWNSSKPAHHTVTYNWLSWWWAFGCSKHVDNWNKQI